MNVENQKILEWLYGEVINHMNVTGPKYAECVRDIRRAIEKFVIYNSDITIAESILYCLGATLS